MITRADTFDCCSGTGSNCLGAACKGSGNLNKGADRQFDVESLPYARHELQAVSGYKFWFSRNC